MSMLEIKDSIIGNLEKVDEAMLLAVQRMLDTYLEARVKSKEPYPEDFDMDGNPINLDELDEISDQMDHGEGIPAEEVYKKAEQWLENSK